MKKNNIIETVEQKIKQLQEARSADLAQIQNKLTEEESKAAKAEAAMYAASERLDAEKYADAEHDLRVARIAMRMYEQRLKQIDEKEMITEAESDAVIDGLLEYEKELADAFRAAIVSPFKKLEELAAEYAKAVEKTERTLSIWQTDIHANYSTRGTMSRIDPATGERTDRSEKPVPVHMLPYEGSPELVAVQKCLKEMKVLYAEN